MCLTHGCVSGSRKRSFFTYFRCAGVFAEIAKKPSKKGSFPLNFTINLGVKG